MSKGKRVKKRVRKISGGTVAVIVLACVVVAAAAGVLGLGAFVAGKDTIYPNITVAGVDIGGMSYDKAHSTLLNAAVGVPTGVKATAKLTETVSVSVTSDEAGLTFSVTDAVDTAYAYGRGGSFFANMFSYLDCMRSTHDVATESKFNESGVRAIIANQAKLANHGSVDSSWQVSGDQILVTKDGSDYTVDEEGVFDFIRTTLLSGQSAETDEFSEAKVGGSAGLQPDFEAIYNEIYVAPQDARFDAETGTTTAAVRGVSFDIDAARALYDAAAPGETVTIPLVYTEPEVQGDDVQALLFRDKLAEKSTDLKGSTANRITNVTLAAKACDGYVLNPGEEFSYNGVVGKRTVEKGYKEATGYAGGTSVPMVGGGICQVSSTLYYCTLLSDLEITYRRSHGLTVSYLPPALDATVNWGTIDFKFKNNREYPIKIRAWVEGNKLYVEIWGTKTDDITIQLESNTLKVIEPTTQTKVDETLKPGQTKVISRGKNGCVAEAYKLYYDGEGNLIKRVFISKDTYLAEKRIVAVGPEDTTAGPTTPTEPKPTESTPAGPEPTESVPVETSLGGAGSTPTEAPSAETVPPDTSAPGGDDPQPDPGDEETEDDDPGTGAVG